MKKRNANENSTCPKCRSKDVRHQGRVFGNYGKLQFPEILGGKLVTIPEIKQFFDHASSFEIMAIRAELDALQDREDERAGKHVPIVITVAILSEIIYQAHVKAQKRRQSDG